MALYWRPSRTRAASGALAQGTTSLRPARQASIATGNTPLTAFNSPPSDNSPMNSHSCRRRSSSCADAAMMPSAIGRSKRLPSLGRSAGASEIVM